MDTKREKNPRVPHLPIAILVITNLSFPPTAPNNILPPTIFPTQCGTYSPH